MSRIRVVVADDSLTVRRHLVDVLSAECDFEVVGEAADGQQAVELCEQLRPSVITMDMMMPQMTGLAATQYIMAYCPTPILIVSASVNRGEVLRTFDALAAGAVDVLDKPSARQPGGAWEKTFLDALRLISRIKPITHPPSQLKSKSAWSPIAEPEVVSTLPKPAPVEHRPARVGNPARFQPAEIVAIGASTGGPAALAAILYRIPADFPLPILLVVHIADQFADGFAQWLDGESKLRVRYAIDGEPLPRPGKSEVIMAPPSRHLVARQGRLKLTDDAERNSCRPSVDVLFESVAREYGSRAAACLLTGMGRDGAMGLLQVRNSGGVTIAQDESTSVVFGMPRAAIEIGAADMILPLFEFVPTLCSMADMDPDQKVSA